MSGTDPYPGSDARERELDELASLAGGSVVEFGQSVEGRPMRAARIPSTAANAASAPRVLINANIHGPEWIGSRTAMGVLRKLAKGDVDANALRASAEIWVVPCINVDGFARTEQERGNGTLKQFRCNANGVDLNRNFPVPSTATSWFARNISSRFTGSGSADPRRATFRGTGPLSEPEARAMVELCAAQRFKACASLHSFMGTCIPPCVTTSAESHAYASLARTFRRAQQRRRYVRLAGRYFDVFTGELEDHLHHELGCWAMTIECFSIVQSIQQHLRAPSVFWRFNPHEPDVVVDNDAPAIIAFLRAALELPHPRARAE